MIISPQDWGLPISTAQGPLPDLDISREEVEQRIRACTMTWLPRHFNADAGAFYGFYSAREKRFEPPQTVNLIAPWQCLAGYDRYGETSLLDMAVRAADWFYARFVETHPMSVVIGGIRESLPNGDLWTKFAAEFVVLCLALYKRTEKDVYLERARQSAGFLIQSGRHGFAPKYHHGNWDPRGWQSFGRVIEAFIALDAVSETNYDAWIIRWAEYGLKLLAGDGGLYLIDGEYFNTDIAADELRAFVYVYERTHERRFLEASLHFANWLLKWQRPDGSWPLTIDNGGNVVVPTAGPGDIPNIAISFLLLHRVTGNTHYLDGAAAALRYTLSMQILPGSEYGDDPNACWGFWSWDPPYDYTLSGDQATHHVRGLMFALDYL